MLWLRNKTLCCKNNKYIKSVQNHYQYYISPAYKDIQVEVSMYCDAAKVNSVKTVLLDDDLKR